MMLIHLSNLLLGGSAGKRQNIDYKTLGLYLGMVTPYQAYNFYNKLDIVSQLHLRAVKPYVHIPMAVSMITVSNLWTFGIAYIVSKELNG